MLEVTVKPARQVAVVGESLLVAVNVRNRGDALVEIGDHGGPVRFELTEPGGTARTLAPRRARLNPIETPRFMPPWRGTIAPGAAMDLRADVADYAGETLAPGQYACAAVVAGARSPSFALTLEAPRATALARAATDADAVAAWIDAGDLFVRASTSDPDLGVAVRALTGLTAPSSVAVTHGFEPWFAVLLDGALGAGLAGPVQLLAWLRGPAPTVEAPRLLTVERIAGVDELPFVIGGARAAQVATLHVDHTGVTPAARELTLGPVLDVALPTSARATNAGGQLTAIWSDGPRLLARTLVPDAVTRTLLDGAALVLAFAPGARGVNVLAGDAGMLVGVRVGLDGATEPFAPLPAPPPGARAWAISPVAAGDAPVAALVGDAILTARDGAWAPVVAVAAGASHLAVVEASWPRTWVEWLDPARGLLHAPIE